MTISMLKIRRPLGRLIFNMGIAIPGKTVFLIETAPCISPAKNIIIFGAMFTLPYEFEAMFLLVLFVVNHFVWYW